LLRRKKPRYATASKQISRLTATVHMRSNNPHGHHYSKDLIHERGKK